MRYSRLLEEGDFRGRTAHYVLMLLFGTTVISMVASYINVHFLGSALTFMMAYVWGRRNEDVKVRERERSKVDITRVSDRLVSITLSSW